MLAFTNFSTSDAGPYQSDSDGDNDIGGHEPPDDVTTADDAPLRDSHTTALRVGGTGMISRLALPALLLSPCTLCAVQALQVGEHFVCPQPPTAADYFEDFDGSAERGTIYIYVLYSANTFDTFSEFAKLRTRTGWCAGFGSLTPMVYCLLP
ncbi:hypothetical protein CYMTET_15796 [Cymbomonas tetramitiformis]|uniref:Uncharacterized protein n=1 Tax=Cymbomonas tetramitiformis TaxID=36881 RepID=A0AAE0GDH5_9CHLO|nr:hypothetical protein CYMTET_15796 [Cymbomonas tetramitiformis]